MLKHCAVRSLLLTIPLGVALGCAEEPAPPAAAERPVPSRVPVAAAVEVPRVDADAGRAANYEPPYPEREHLFAPPERTRTTARRSADGDDDSVQLLGFVSVDQPKAVLSIDGVIASVPAGAAKYGIEVISIAPPEVVLQRGRNRWTTSLD